MITLILFTACLLRYCGHAMALQIALQVLVVDDNPGILSALTCLLQRDGHTVETATDGQAALALLGEHGYDSDPV